MELGKENPLINVANYPTGGIISNNNNMLDNINEMKMDGARAGAGGERNRCKNEEDSFISLGSILRTYNAPISEEHAWALCYSIAEFLEGDEGSSSAYFCIGEKQEDIDLIMINKDGELHLDMSPECFNEGEQINGREEEGEEGFLLMTPSELIAKLAVIIYKALDFGLKEDEERTLGAELENLLGNMVSSSSSTPSSTSSSNYDDGDGEEGRLTSEDILSVCQDHLRAASRNRAYSKSSKELLLNGEVYHNICKELVKDALEFAKFLRIANCARDALENINLSGEEREQQKCSSNSSSNSNEYPKLMERNRSDNFKTVARLWIQVVKEFQEGRVNLKSNQNHKELLVKKKEYQKTPYELLLEDIKTKRYQLRRVPADKKSSLVEGGTRRSGSAHSLHDIVLEYVRSKPKLRRASERNLVPLKEKCETPYDRLMDSIRQVDSRPPLRSVKSIRPEGPVQLV